MSFNALLVPTLPFENFKWQWACLQCTEGLNDPVVLLGVLFRMRKLELLNRSIKYSSNEFKHELEELADDIRKTDVGVDLARRTGERNLIRNSGQYWSALGLIPSERTGGVIRLTEFGRRVAESKSGGFIDLVGRLKATSVVSEIERKRVQEVRSRPNQARFRRAVLGTSPRCVITNVTMPEVLEAAHIVPYKYKGEDTAANGLTMRMDIHQLFDSGHLRIHANGTVFLTDRARMDYGALIPPLIHLPPMVNPDFVRWRWENYNGL